MQGPRSCNEFSGLSFVGPGADNVTSVLVGSLQTGSVYYVRAHAVSFLGGGDSDLSLPRSAIPAGVPDTPPGVTAVALSKTSLRVEWNVTQANGRPVTHYRLELNTVDTFDAATAVVDTHSGAVAGDFMDFGAATEVVDGRFRKDVYNLSTGVKYYVRVAAFNAEGRSSPDGVPPTPGGTVTPAIEPEQPATASLIVPSATELTLSFFEVGCSDPGTDACNGLPVTRALVEWNDTSADGLALPTMLQATVNISAADAVDGFISLSIPPPSYAKRLTPGQRYHVRVSVGNGIGFSTFMSPTPESAVPAGDGSTPLKAAKSCREVVLFFPNSTDGLYWLNPGYPAVDSFRAHCDMLTEGGGWTLAAKLKDHTAGLDNHLSHKYVGASWYSDDTSLETVVTGTAADRSRPLLPFADDDALWGNYDISLFGDFTQMLFYFLKTNSDVSNNKFYMYVPLFRSCSTQHHNTCRTAPHAVRCSSCR